MLKQFSLIVEKRMVEKMSKMAEETRKEISDLLRYCTVNQRYLQDTGHKLQTAKEEKTFIAKGIEVILKVLSEA